MPGLVEYVKKTTLGLGNLVIDPSVGPSPALSADCSIALHVNDAYVTTLHLRHVVVFHWFGFVDAVKHIRGCLTFPSVDNAVKAFLHHGVCHRRFDHYPLQLFVGNVPIITLEDWQAYSTVVGFHLNGTWLELDNPEAFKLWQSLSDTYTRQR